MSFYRHASSLVILLAISAPALAATEFVPAREVRAQMIYRPLTPDERLVLLDQALLFFGGAYSNLALKQKTYGPHVDPVGRFDKLKNNPQWALSAADFAAEINDIVADTHDRHNFIRLPGPIACYNANLPLTIHGLWSSNNKIKLVVGHDRLRAYEALAPQIAKLSPGDEIVTYNKLKAEAALNGAVKRIKLSREVNPSNWLFEGAFRLHQLYVFQQGTPDTDEVELVVRKKSGVLINVKVPWITSADTDCLAKYSLQPKTGAKTELLTEAPYTNGLSFKASDIEGVSSALMDVSGRRIGILKVEHFSFDSTEAETKLKAIIETEFASTDGVIIDVRNNFGGYPQLGEKLAEIFSDLPTRTIQKKVIITPLATFLADTAKATSPDAWGLGAGFADSILKAALLGEKFSSLTPYLDAQVITGGFRYRKPVAVFTNAGCTSACESFAATMKDSRGALIVGENESTAGAGAATFRHRDFFNYYIPADARGPFRALPVDADIRVGWLQQVRLNGELIEDQGVKSDHVIRPRNLAEHLGDRLYPRVAARLLNF